MPSWFEVVAMQATQATQNAHVHPAVAQALNAASGIPVQLRRADYVSRLTRLGHWCELHEAYGDNMARDEEGRLRLMRDELDPDGELWNKHAPIQFRDAYEVRTFKDFTGACPVTVEWVLYPQGAKVVAVVVETAAGPKTIHTELSIGALARYQLQAEQLASKVVRS